MCEFKQQDFLKICRYHIISPSGIWDINLNDNETFHDTKQTR